ncbi:oligogalacturonate lyase family protein [Caulobacter segnis]
MEIFTLDLKTGDRKVVHASDKWLGHARFSPTDPALAMFCHEGPLASRRPHLDDPDGRFGPDPRSTPGP